jgi:anti-anti-sigma regulatory factor
MSSGMLRIVRNDADQQRVVLILEGRIVAAWADMLERVCLEAMRSDRPVVLDLSGVALIARSGKEALGRLARAGVGITGCSPLIADMLEQDGIAVIRTNGDTSDRAAPKQQGGSSGA